MSQPPGENFARRGSFRAGAHARILLLPRMFRGSRLTLRAERGKAFGVPAFRVPRFAAFGIEPLRDAVFHFVGVAEDIAIVEAQNTAEVVDARDVAVSQAGFNHMFELASAPLAKHTLQGWRPQIERHFQGVAVDGVIGGNVRAATELLRVVRLAQTDLRSQGPSLPVQRQCYAGAKIKTPYQVRRAERRLAAREPFRGPVQRKKQR